MTERAGLPDNFKEAVTASMGRLVKVMEVQDLPSSDTRDMLKLIKPLMDLMASNPSLVGQEKEMFANVGEPSDGYAKGVVSPQGLTLEEHFSLGSQIYIRNIFWDTQEPDRVEVYSMPKNGDFTGTSRIFSIPLDGNLTTLQFK